MPRRRPSAQQLLLPFDGVQPATPGAASLWERVDGLNARTLRAHLLRRKPVKPRMRQPGLLDPDDDD
jgi:hypothetical protein